MSDTLEAVGGFALIIGLFVAYARERRARNRPAAPVPPPVAVPEAPVQPAVPVESSGGGSSPNWGAPIIYCLLLWGGAQHTNWRYLWLTLYAGVMAIAVHTMVSAKEFAIERRRNPALSRREHWVNTGVPYLLFPLAGLALVLAGVPGGVLVPALPWVFIILAAVIILPAQAVVQQVRKLWRKT